jgi:hypothetical protein
MNEPSPAPGQPPKNGKALTPMQIGAGVGAAVAVLIQFVLSDLNPYGAVGSLSSIQIGLFGAVGAVLGLAVVALANFVRSWKKQKSAPRESPKATAQETLAPEGKKERNGNPLIRIAAGLFAFMFAGFLPLMIAQGALTWQVGTAIVALAVLFGWYAVRGNNGLPGSHSP